MSPLHQWARFYAARGWHVFPLVPGTKSPFKGSHGSSEATCDLAQVDTWWRAEPNANIGVRPAGAGLYVFDVDPRNGGADSFAALQAQHGQIDSPLAVDSPGGGFHLYFAADPAQRYSGAPATGIDGKYNGYAVLPPSVHPNGGRYQWRGEPGAIAAPAPAWLATGSSAPREHVAHATDLADLELIRRALQDRDPSDYWSWVNAIASVKYWEDHTPDAGTAGYELVREWSELDPRHDDGQFEDKWSTFDSFKPGARTLGSLLHEAGLTATQQAVDAASAFAGLAPEQQAALWTTEPVPDFKGSLDPNEVQAELLAANSLEYCEHWSQGNLKKLIDAIAWRSGGCCETVLQVLLTHPGLVGGDTPELRGLIAHNCANRSTWFTVGKLTAEQLTAEAAGICARVQVDDGTLVSAFRQCVTALPVLGDVFQRDGRLTWVDPKGRMGEFDVHSLSHELETFLRFEKGPKAIPTKCPESLARRILGHRNYVGVQEIAAAIPMPVARPDGSAITAPGLDEATGLYLLRGADREPLALDDDHLRAALSRVWSPFAEFPFASPAACGVMLAALLTTVCRAALPTAPAFLINAQAAGTGKTKLSKCLMIAACSSDAALALPREAAEQAKTLVSAMLPGPRGIMFDNVKGVLDAGAEFCSAMTSSSYAARGLGGLQMLNLQNRALWVLNGNNVGLKGDIVRRVLTIALDSSENPETQLHGFDPTEVVRNNLAAFRADLLDILATYCAAGMPTMGAQGFASFEEWGRLVRNCVLWLMPRGVLPVEIADPLQTMTEAQQEDPEVTRLRMMLEAWFGRFGEEPQFLRDVAASPFEQGELADLWAEAYESVCTYKGRTDDARLQYWMRTVNRKKLDGMMFVNEKAGKGRTRWRICKI